MPYSRVAQPSVHVMPVVQAVSYELGVLETVLETVLESRE